MRAPRFWERGRGRLVGPLLAPAAALWRAATRRRLARGAWERLERPVICVGNLTVGGTGKTPTVLAIVERLTASGHAVAVVTRGYGGSLAGPVRVDPRCQTSAEVGDEALLVAGWAPVWVGRNRAAAGRQAIADGAEVLVLDDGLQNPSLVKDVSILVVDAGQGFGNGRVIPAGPLREPVADGLARADLVLAVGSGRERLIADHPPLAERPLMTGRIAPLLTGMPWQGLRVLAFAGIGRPDKAFATLRGLGADVVRTRSFGDHEPYTQAILERLAAEARSLSAQLVTTEKDAVRLPADFRRQVLVLPVRMEIDDWRPFDEAIAPLLPPRDER